MLELIRDIKAGHCHCESRFGVNAPELDCLTPRCGVASLARSPVSLRFSPGQEQFMTSSCDVAPSTATLLAMTTSSVLNCPSPPSHEPLLENGWEREIAVCNWGKILSIAG